MIVRSLGCAVLVGLLAGACERPRPAVPAAASAPAIGRWGLIVHGGAGPIRPETRTPEREAALRAALEEALRQGHAVLASGGSSKDAVVKAVMVLEDSPLFNAGKGAVFTHEGTHELDAAIMVGRPRAAGAVAGLRTIKNPITLARAVMERSPHVMLIGEGAERFAQELGLERVDPSYFDTEERRQQLQEQLAKERAQGTAAPPPPHAYLGTVGAVALDRSGVLAAATSTGGMTNKRYGRVGDVPIIGAGTYADERCAVSATGHGEHFIRQTVAHDICARAAYLHLPLERAARQVVLEELVALHADGGVIAMDREGHVAMPFNSQRMYRGVIGEDGAPRVMIHEP